MAAAYADRAELVAQFVAATDWSCENGEALLAAHNWSLQDALAEALGVDQRAHVQCELKAQEFRAREQQRFDRDVAAAMAASHADTRTPPAASSSSSPQVLAPARLAEDVRELLEHAGLAPFEHAFAEHGYDEMAIVQQMGADDMDEVGLKGGHKLKLKEALKHRAVKQGSTARQGEAASGPPAAGTPAEASPEASLGPATAAAPKPSSSGPPAAASREAAAGLLARLGGKPAAGGEKRRYIKDGKITYVDDSAGDTCT